MKRLARELGREDPARQAEAQPRGIQPYRTKDK